MSGTEGGIAPPKDAPRDPWTKNADKIEDELFPEEIKLLKEIRKTCPEAKYYSDHFLSMCIFARKSDLKRIKQLIENNWKWRIENNFEELPTYEDLVDNPGLWNSGYIVPGARTKSGHFIVYLKPALMYPKEFTVKDFANFMAFLYLHAIRFERLDGFRNGFVFVEDFGGYGWKNFDTKLQKAMTSMLQDIFPITYKKIFILHPPPIMRPALAICRLFTKKKLLDRLKIVTSEELKEYIDDQQIPIEFGGKRDWNGRKFHEYIRRWECDFLGIKFSIKNLDNLHSNIESKNDLTFNPQDYQVHCLYCDKQILSIDMEEHIVKCMKEHPRSIEELD